MSKQQDTLPLLLSLVISGAILGGGSWYVLRQLTGSTLVTQPSPFPNGSSPTNSTVNSPGEVATFAEVRNVPEGNFRYGGSTTFAPIREIVDRAILTVWPKFQFVYLDPISGTPGSGKGIEMLIDNQLSFSQSSRSLKDEEQKQAQAKQFSLQEIPVAIDGIAVAVNPHLKVAGLTVAQVKDIYTGKIANWQEVGGPNLPIIPYSRDPKDGGTVEFFQSHVLDKEAFGSNVQYVYSTTPGLRKIAENRGGIYYASAPEVVPQCEVKPLPLGKTQGQWVAPYQEPYVPAADCPKRRNTLNIAAFQQATYPITRNIFVIVKKNRRFDEQAGVAYANLLLSQQGQDLIAKAGFVPLK